MMWILTQSYNDYDQHGEYFRVCWSTKPTAAQVKQALGGIADQLVEHILAGGGRQKYENDWYHLREYRPGKLYDEDD